MICCVQRIKKIRKQQFKSKVSKVRLHIDRDSGRVTFGAFCFIENSQIILPVEKNAFAIIKHQLALDLECKTPSLLAKWMPSENTSSKKTRVLATKMRKYLKMTHKQYRKVLSTLRARINIVERLMSAGKWDEIEFDKIPSKAGLIYKNAFAKRDIIAKKYEAFAKNTETNVNAKALYPHEIAQKCFENRDSDYHSVDRLMLQKYWDNLPNFYGDNEENGLAIVDVSGSMYGLPLNAAVSLGAYMAEKAHGPFAGHFVTFSERPELVEFSGVDITDKFKRAEKADWMMNTNLEAVFDLLLKTAKSAGTKKEDMPTRLYILSDMQFDGHITYGAPVVTRNLYWSTNGSVCRGMDGVNTLVDTIAAKWRAAGYELPSIVWWNLNAQNQNIPSIGKGFSYVSGFSPSILKSILSGKDGIDLMLETLNSDRYSAINL